MITKKLIKKLSILISCLVVVQIVSIYPKNNKDINTSTIASEGIVYLLDNKNYVSRLNVVLTSFNKNEKIREIIKILTNDKTYPIRDGFKAIIPKNTKLLNLYIKDNIITLNFSKEILNISPTLEEKMIESIVYTMTSIKDIDKVIIKVDGNTLNYLPNSRKRLIYPLDRSIGINKEYNISNVKGIDKTTVFKLAKYENFIYYIPVSKYSNEKNEKIEVIIEELKSNDSLNSNIVSYLSNETKLINYNILDKTMILNFNDAIFSDINSNTISSEVIYTINLSIKENYNKDTVVYYVDNNLIANYFLVRG